jgi:transcription antitermination factor NusG
MHEGRWSVLHVITNHEKRVTQHLAARSAEHYLPVYSQRSRWTDRVVQLERPLFAGYVFVRFAPEARLSVVSIPGVLRLLGNTERDTVSEVEMSRIREGLASGCSLRPHPAVALGSQVRVLRGVFEGAMGVVSDFRRQCRVVMAISATGQCFSLEVGLEDLEILHPPPASEMAGRPRQLALGRA